MYFVMRAFQEYALLNEEREVILKKIKERGLCMGNDVIFNKIETIHQFKDYRNYY